MEYRILGHTGVSVSSLCLGAMEFGGTADEAESKRIIEAALDVGVNFFDTANVYNQGASEEILGRALSNIRDEVVLSTKAFSPVGLGPNDRGASRYHLVRAVEDSLRRLGTDRIDLYFLHGFDEHTALEETLRAVEELVRSGKILYPAVSNYSAWQVMKALGISQQRGFAPIACIQPMYSLVKRQAEVELLPMAASEGIGVITYSPTGGGLLTGRYGTSRKPQVGRIVDKPMYGARYGDPNYYKVAEAFATLAERESVSPVTLAVAWAGAHPAVTAPIIGGRSVEQIRASLTAADYDISDALYREVAELWPAPPPATDRSEERQGKGYATQLLSDLTKDDG